MAELVRHNTAIAHKINSLHRDLDLQFHATLRLGIDAGQASNEDMYVTIQNRLILSSSVSSVTYTQSSTKMLSLLSALMFGIEILLR